MPSVTATFDPFILMLADMLSGPGSPLFSHVCARIAGVAASANMINADLINVLPKDLCESHEIIAVG
jgi:hypothetical protein